uniref:Initiation-specific alpha-1,6-mannosyltransferase n=1 Tax=Bionectria ochroleuca TaxID=29856 RepID=A0A0B7K2M6_BIOOC
MLNSRRALVAACFILVVFFLISRSSHDTTTVTSTTSRTSDSDTQKPVSENPGSQDVSGYGASVVAGAPSNRRPAAIRTPQKPMNDMSHMSTYDKLAYAYPYDVTLKFPAYIWQTWKSTPADEGFEFREQESSWSDQHPGFIHEVINDDVARDLLRLLYASVPEVLEAYSALPLPVLKADLFRYLILYARGGIYSDIDTYAIKSASDRRIQFCQWTIQSKPGHPALRDVIARITKEVLELKRAGKLAKFVSNDVVGLTGPAVWTDTIMDYFNDGRFFDMSQSKGTIDYRNFTGMTASKRVGDVVVLPITSFSPGVGQMGAGETDDPMAFVKHEFEGTWKPESERHIGETKTT